MLINIKNLLSRLNKIWIICRDAQPGSGQSLHELLQNDLAAIQQDLRTLINYIQDVYGNPKDFHQIIHCSYVEGLDPQFVQYLQEKLGDKLRGNEWKLETSELYGLVEDLTHSLEDPMVVSLMSHSSYFRLYPSDSNCNSAAIQQRDFFRQLQSKENINIVGFDNQGGQTSEEAKTRFDAAEIGMTKEIKASYAKHFRAITAQTMESLISAFGVFIPGIKGATFRVPEQADTVTKVHDQLWQIKYTSAGGKLRILRGADVPKELMIEQPIDIEFDLTPSGIYLTRFELAPGILRDMIVVGSVVRPVIDEFERQVADKQLKDSDARAYYKKHLPAEAVQPLAAVESYLRANIELRSSFSAEALQEFLPEGETLEDAMNVADSDVWKGSKDEDVERFFGEAGKKSEQVVYLKVDKVYRKIHCTNNNGQLELSYDNVKLSGQVAERVKECLRQQISGLPCNLFNATLGQALGGFLVNANRTSVYLDPVDDKTIDVLVKKADIDSLQYMSGREYLSFSAEDIGMSGSEMSAKVTMTFDDDGTIKALTPPSFSVGILDEESLFAQLLLYLENRNDAKNLNKLSGALHPSLYQGKAAVNTKHDENDVSCSADISHGNKAKFLELVSKSSIISIMLNLVRLLASRQRILSEQNISLDEKIIQLREVNHQIDETLKQYPALFAKEKMPVVSAFHRSAVALMLSYPAELSLRERFKAFWNRGAGNKALTIGLGVLGVAALGVLGVFGSPIGVPLLGMSAMYFSLVAVAAIASVFIAIGKIIHSKLQTAEIKLVAKANESSDAGVEKGSAITLEPLDADADYLNDDAEYGSPMAASTSPDTGSMGSSERRVLEATDRLRTDSPDSQGIPTRQETSFLTGANTTAGMAVALHGSSAPLVLGSGVVEAPEAAIATSVVASPARATMSAVEQQHSEHENDNTAPGLGSRSG